MGNVIILGPSGMLGNAVAKQVKDDKLSLSASLGRSNGFDVQKPNWPEILLKSGLNKGDYIINCVGVTKSHIDDQSNESRSRALKVNAEFPLNLARFAADRGVKVLQVATDCVFSGSEGSYTESSSHDALDVYGKTKSLGEANSNAVMSLRCSLIGPESGRNTLLYEWIRTQDMHAVIPGYTDHYWNGLTSAAVARVITGVIKNQLFFPGIQHLVPADEVSKHDLVTMIVESLGRKDVSVKPEPSGTQINRVLSTINPSVNMELFNAAGYTSIPTIRRMVDELGELERS